MRIRWKVQVVMAAALLVLLAACGGNGGGSSSSGGRTTLHVLVYPGSVIDLPIWTAQAEGFCAKQNINCVATKVQSGPLGLQLLASGDLQVFYASTDVTVEAASHGAAVSIIGGIRPDNFYDLLVRNGVKLPHRSQGYPAVMQDLMGKVIGVNALGAGSQLEAEALFAGAGISPAKATYVAVGAPATEYTALTNGRVDAVMASTPVPAICQVEHTCSSLVNLQNTGPQELKSLNGAFTTFVAEKSYVASHKAAIKGFITAMQQTFQWLKNPGNLNAAVQIAQKNINFSSLPGSQKVLRAAVENEVNSFGIGVKRSAVSAFSAYLLQHKLIKQQVPASSLVSGLAPNP